jgi:hypothetical protein
MSNNVVVYDLSDSDFSNHNLCDEDFEEEMSHDTLGSITCHLRQNAMDFELLDLEICIEMFEQEDDNNNGSNRMEELTAALLQNTTVTNAFISCDGYNDMNSNERWRKFFQAIVSLPKLTTLYLHSHEGISYNLASSFLSFVVNQAALHQTLVELQLSDIIFQGSFDEFEDFGQALQRLTSLRRFIIFCGLLEDSMQLEANWFGPVLTGLSRLPQLSSLKLEAFDYGRLGKLDPIALESLFHSPSLLLSNFEGFEFLEEHMLAIAGALSYPATSPTNLKSLGLDGCQVLTSNTTIKSLASMLRTNQILETLELCMRVGSGEHEIDKSGTLNLEDIAAALEINSSLRVLGLKISSSSSPTISDETLPSFVRMLRSNYSLEVLRLWPFCKEYRSKIDLFLKLNKIGRGNLMRQQRTATKKQWVAQLSYEKVRDDLDCVYYFLSANPSLCNVG